MLQECKTEEGAKQVWAAGRGACWRRTATPDEDVAVTPRSSPSLHPVPEVSALRWCHSPPGPAPPGPAPHARPTPSRSSRPGPWLGRTHSAPCCPAPALPGRRGAESALLARVLVIGAVRGSLGGHRTWGGRGCLETSLKQTENSGAAAGAGREGGVVPSLRVSLAGELPGDRRC